MSDVSVVGRLLDMALDGGVNFLDTAACYGNSEEWIGRTISHRRQEYVLATKAGHVVEGYVGEKRTARTIRDSIERSLTRMKTNYLDLVQLHSCEVDILRRGEATQALRNAVTADLVLVGERAVTSQTALRYSHAGKQETIGRPKLKARRSEHTHAAEDL